MTVSVSPLAYGLSTLFGAVLAVVLCVAARRWPGRWATVAACVLGAVLIGEQLSWQLQFLADHNWSLAQSLPFDLCDFTCYVAAVACWWRVPVCVELTWFWGLVGTLQAVITPDIGTPFPRLSFDEYVVEHLGIVVTGLFLVIGLRLYPRRGAVRRAFLLTLAYAAVVALIDLATSSDYLFLRAPPAAFSLLQVLGPWPWYIVSCAGIALVGFALLDLPFRARRRFQPGSVGNVALLRR